MTDLDARILSTVDTPVVAVDGADRVVRCTAAMAQLLDAERSLSGVDLRSLPEVTALTAESASDLAAACERLREGDATEATVDVRIAPHDGAVRRRAIHLSVEDAPVGAASTTGDLSNTDPAGPLVCGVGREPSEAGARERFVDSLHAVARGFEDADTADAVCSMAVHAAVNVLDLPFSGVWIHDEELDRLTPVAASAQAHERLGGLPQFRRNEGLVWDAFLTGESALYADVRDHDGVYNPDTPIRSELIVPVGCYGVLMVASESTDALDETDRELAEILAAHTAAALERVDRQDRLAARDRVVERLRERLDVVRSIAAGMPSGPAAPGRSTPTADRDPAAGAVESLPEPPAPGDPERPGSDGVETSRNGGVHDPDRLDGAGDGARPDPGERGPDRGSAGADEVSFGSDLWTSGPDAADEHDAETGDPGHVAGVPDAESERDRYLDAIDAVVGGEGDPEARSSITLGSAVSAAVAAVVAVPVTLVIEGNGTLRADDRRLVSLFEWFVDGATARSDGTTVTVAPVDDGFVVRDDTGIESVPAPTAPDGLGPAVARGIALAHGWDATLTATDGLELLVEDVRSLSAFE